MSPFHSKQFLLAFTFCAAIFIGCHERPADHVVSLPKTNRFEGEGFVTVQHILIKADSPGRTREEAKKLAQETFEAAQKVDNEAFDELVEKYGEDAYPARFTMADRGKSFDRNSHVSERGGYVKGFGDASFEAEVGETVLVPFDKKDSPYGWHIIRRLK